MITKHTVMVLLVACLLPISHSYAWFGFTGGPVIDYGKLATSQAKVAQLIEETLRLELNLFEMIEQVKLLGDQFALNLEIYDSWGSNRDVSPIITQKVTDALAETRGGYFDRRFDEEKIAAVEEEKFLLEKDGRGSTEAIMRRSETLRQIGGAGEREVSDLNITARELQQRQLEDDYLEYAMIMTEQDISRWAMRKLRDTHLEIGDISASEAGIEDAERVSILNSWNQVADAKKIKNEATILGHDGKMTLQYNKLSTFQRRNEYISKLNEEDQRKKLIERIMQ